VTGDKPDTLLEPSQKKALNTALRILTPRDHSKYELVQKLKQRGFSREVIDAAISSCERFDYINDERTASRVFWIKTFPRMTKGRVPIAL